VLRAKPWPNSFGEHGRGAMASFFAATRHKQATHSHPITCNPTRTFENQRENA
jgi:hypothetical protein